MQTTPLDDWPLCGKFRFGRRYLAQRVRDKMVRGRHRGERLEVYWCKPCRSWHIGSSLKRGRGPRWGGRRRRRQAA